MHSRSLTFVLFGVMILGPFACTRSKLNWSAEEKANSRHFFQSLEARQAATRLSNQGSPFSKLSENDRKHLIQLLGTALEEATLVRDDVLVKAHPEVKQHFRNEYQKGLELQKKNLEEGDARAEIEGSLLDDRFGDWLDANQNEIRIPK